MSVNELRADGRRLTVRDSNLELYRILAMLLIIAHHYVVNSGLTSADGPIYADVMSPASLFLLIWGAWGKIGINCFVLITGYFMCKSRISAKKFVKLLFCLMFYRIVIYSIFLLSGYEPFSLKTLLKAIVPIRAVEQNFTGTYLIFYLCIPFLNILIGNLNEKQHIRLMCLAVFTYVFFGTVPYFSVSMNYVSWYIVLYLTASYIRLYPKKLFSNTRLWGIATGVCAALCILSVIACSWIGEKLGKNMSFSFVTDSNTLLAFATGVCSFLFFKNVKLQPSRLINTVSSTTFGILMIHANSDTMRRWLWQDVLNNVGMYSSRWLVPHAIVSVIVVFTLCCLIELARIRFVETPFLKLWEKWESTLGAKFSVMEDRILKKANVGSPEAVGAAAGEQKKDK